MQDLRKFAKRVFAVPHPHVDVPVETPDERAVFKAAERTIDEIQYESERQEMKTGAVLANGARFTMQ